MAEVVNEVRTAQHVVTGENRKEFMNKRLDIAAPMAKVVTPESKTAEEKKAEAKPAAEEKKAEPEKKEEHPINERFSQMAEKRREAEAREKAAAERAEKAERELQELRTKATPPPLPEKAPDPIDAKPTRDQFQSDTEFMEKLVDWSIKKDRAERAAEESKAREETARSQVLTTWQQRLNKAREDLPDYNEKIESAKDVVFSNQVRDAILESDVGPLILYHFADHRDEAEKLRGMSINAALLSLGRLEAKLTQKEKEVTNPPVLESEKKTATVSRAPAPISTLKASSAPENLVGSDGKFSGNYKQYKQLRKEGKLK